LITAAHVITAPIERNYGDVAECDDITWQMRKLNFGVLVTTNPLFQRRGFTFFPFEWMMFLAEKRPHPIPFRGIDLKLNSDIGICKVPLRADGRAHQPLTLVQSGIRGKSLVVGASVGAIGYVGMEPEVELRQDESGASACAGAFDLHGSVGNILEWLPDNTETRTASTPGPCFSFQGKVPAGMSANL